MEIKSELIFSLKLKSPIIEPKRLKKTLSLNCLILIVKKKVIPAGAIPQIIIVEMVKTAYAMFIPLLQSNPLFISVSDYSERAR